MAETDRKKMRLVWRAHKLIWNLSGGRLGRKMGGIPVLELVATGHRSGLERQILICTSTPPGVRPSSEPTPDETLIRPG